MVQALHFLTAKTCQVWIRNYIYSQHYDGCTQIQEITFILINIRIMKISLILPVIHVA